jgi:hypothetical protein
MHLVPPDKRRITPAGARLFCQLSRIALLEADVNFLILKQSGNPTFDPLSGRMQRLIRYTRVRTVREIGVRGARTAFQVG